jgi:hypothetical protein
MYGAHDLLTRWPALNVAARRAKLQDSLRLASGPLTDIIAASTPAAERIAGALWRREPSAWGSDASEQRTIANRLGWMSSPFLMAESIVLISATPDQDVPIPGEAFSFGTLERAQALGDFASLDATERRAVHVQLPSADPAVIRRVADALLAHVGV